jgi:hypothetical protein
MFHVYAAMPTPHDACHKESGFDDELKLSSGPWKGRGRTHSDDLSTAAPSPEASPLFGPQRTNLLDGPDDLILPDLCGFQLPDAQELSGSDAELEFELAGFDECKEDSDLASTRSCEDSDSETNEDEDIESQLLDLISELASIRAEQRQQLQEPATSLQKIPYPQLESGFLPAQFMPCQSWQLPAGRAETGHCACAMAPRPSFDSMEPLNIVLSAAGATLEIASPDADFEQRRLSNEKAVFRKRRGRSRSPLMSMEEMNERGALDDNPRGRPRFWTRG